jgi:group I intron endonuclease
MAETAVARSGVYVARNTISGRVYVGSSVNISQRWRKHKEALRRGKHHSRIFQDSWDKHGDGAFTWEVLEDVHPEQRLLFEREQHWIDALRAYGRDTGLNRRPSSDSFRLGKHSDETKAKMSAAHKGKPKTAEHRANLSAANMGKTLSDETRAALRAAHAASGKAAAFLHKFWAEMTPEAHRALRAKASATKRGVPLRHKRSLTYEQAQEARALKADGWTYDNLTERFGLDRASMFRLIKGITYTVP